MNSLGWIREAPIVIIILLFVTTRDTVTQITARNDNKQHNKTCATLTASEWPGGGSMTLFQSSGVERLGIFTCLKSQINNDRVHVESLIRKLDTVHLIDDPSTPP